MFATRLRILELVITKTLDLERLTAARVVLESATDRQVNRILLTLGRDEHGLEPTCEHGHPRSACPLLDCRNATAFGFKRKTE